MKNLGNGVFLFDNIELTTTSLINVNCINQINLYLE